MRVFACAAIAALALAAGTAGASARTWTDPAGRVSFEAPDGWSVNPERPPNMTYVVAGIANYECHVLAIPRENSASSSPQAIRNTAANDATFTPEIWTQLTSGLTSVFRDGAVQVLSRSSEKDGRFWPIQRAELQGSERPVHAAMQMRPGLDLLTLCQTYEGDEPTAAFDALIRSIATPNDAALQAQAEQQDQAQQAAAAAAQAAPGEGRRP